MHDSASSRSKGPAPTISESLPRAVPRAHDARSALGPGRLDGVRAERAQASAQIGRSLKAWRQAAGGAEPAAEAPAAESAEGAAPQSEAGGEKQEAGGEKQEAGGETQEAGEQKEGGGEAAGDEKQDAGGGDKPREGAADTPEPKVEEAPPDMIAAKRQPGHTGLRVFRAATAPLPVGPIEIDPWTNQQQEPRWTAYERLPSGRQELGTFHFEVVGQQTFLAGEVNMLYPENNARKAANAPRVYARDVMTQLATAMGAAPKTPMRAHWAIGMPGNLRDFNANLASGKSVKDAALETPSGRWCKSRGLTKVTLETPAPVQNQPQVSPNYKDIYVRFEWEDPAQGTVRTQE